MILNSFIKQLDTSFIIKEWKKKIQPIETISHLFDNYFYIDTDNM